MSITDAIKNSVLESFRTTISTADILLGLTAALLGGLFILLIYRRTLRAVVMNRSFGLTLVLVCAISAMIVLTITSNLALSLGMVGALSIVRFRTAIKDASDTAFMFWAVAAGITAGAGFYKLTLIGCLFIGALCLVANLLGSRSQRPYLLVVKAGSGQAAEPVEKALEGSRMAYRLSSMTDTAAGAELIYELGFRPDCTDAVMALKQLEGVTAVTLVDCKKG